MQCELCGRLCRESFRVIVEGSNVGACPDCAKLGRVVERVQKEKRPVKPVVRQKPKPDDVFEASGKRELIDDCSERIRRARENLKLKQEDLAKLIAEPVSLVHRIESGRMIPSPVVAREIERKLNVSLFEEGAAGGVKFEGEGSDGNVTLGDIVVVRRKKD